MPLRKHCKAIFVYFLLVMPITAFSQNWEFGGMLGGSYYYGDVNNELSVSQIRYSAGFLTRYHVNERLVLRGNLIYARIAGVDSLSTSEYQRARNLNFYSDVFEASFQVEFNLLEDRTRGRRIKNRVIPYVFGGIGGFYFSPMTEYLGKTWDLAALRTSGITYDKFAICFPLGIGMRYYLTPKWLLGLEFGARYTTTSDLDDIRGSSSVYPDPVTLPNDNSRLVYDRNNPLRTANEIGYGKPGKLRGKINSSDIYFIFGVTLSYKMNMLGGRKFMGKAIRCPRFY